MKTFAILLAFGSTVQAGIADAVVKVGGCSGVCVDPSGIVLTAKHCNLSERETIRFPNHPPIEGRRIYVDELAEGIVAFDVDGDGWPFVVVADDVPVAGEKVQSGGYPVSAGGSQRWASGEITGGSVQEFIVNGKPRGKFRANGVDFHTGPGWSGGPLFNSRREVIGILSAGDKTSSVFVSWTATRKAYAATVKQSRLVPGRESLIVFGFAGCPWCQHVKRDIAAGRFSAYAVEYVDIETREGGDRYHALIAALEKATGKKQPEGFPAFHVAGRASIHVGYAKSTGLRRLLDWGRETLRLPVTLLDTVTGEGPGVSLPPAGFGQPSKWEPKPPESIEIVEDVDDTPQEPATATESTPKPEKTSDDDTDDDTDDEGGGLPWGAILSGLGAALAEGLRDRFRQAA